MKFEFVKHLSDEQDVIDVNTIEIDFSNKDSISELDHCEIEILKPEKEIRFHKQSYQYTYVWICTDERLFNIIDMVVKMISGKW